MGRQHVGLHLPVFILLSLAAQVVVPQLQYSSRSYQHSFSRAPTPGFRYDAGRVIRDAVRIAEAEENLMEQRVARGVDKKLEDYKDVEPILFIEISEIEPRVAYNCRVINWIARLARQRRIPDPLPRLLGHPEAKQLGVTCPFTPPDCSHFSTYRTIDGMCNNPSTSHLGGAFTPFRREAEPEHETGRSYIAGDTFLREDFPRTTGVLGRPLPSARQVSLRVHQSGSDVNPESTCSFILTLWGQFLAHDLAERAPRKGYREVPIECCDQTVKSPAGVCFNIDIQRTDFFRQFGRRCLAFARSAEATDFHCSTGKREVLNQASSFLDGGSVYGVTLSKIRRLRKFEGGLMETSVPNNLPMSPHPNVKAAAQGFSLFLAGDDRANEFTGLVGLETIWVREHNRIAQILSDYNPRWDDHRLFLETRRIIISMLQHITYNEYLPKLIPKELHHKYDLVLEKYGNYHGYNRRVDPRVTNLFATAAFRFGHSMMRSTFNLMKEDYRQGRSPALNLKHMFFTSNGYTQTEHSFMRGMTSDASEKCDRIVTSDFIDHLYETKHGNGFDLAAFNIQRGRDHGLPGYNFWRKHYGLPVASAFSTNKRTGFVDHDYDAVNRLKSVYDHPDDVDVWTGGISELTGGRENVLGPLFANIIANQFRALRQGDRFWYENSFPGSLSLDQLSEIRKVTLARVLCNHIDFVTIQQEVFTIPTEPGNGRVSCGTFPDIDLRPWREY